MFERNKKNEFFGPHQTPACHGMCLKPAEGGIKWSGCATSGLSPTAWYEFARFRACIASSLGAPPAFWKFLAPVSDLLPHLSVSTSTLSPPLVVLHEIHQDSGQPIRQLHCQPFLHDTRSEWQGAIQHKRRAYSLQQQQALQDVSAPAVVCTGGERHSDGMYTRLEELSLASVGLTDIVRKALGESTSNAMQEAVARIILASACAPRSNAAAQCTMDTLHIHKKYCDW
jgi:hypothetical protein